MRQDALQSAVLSDYNTKGGKAHCSTCAFW